MGAQSIGRQDLEGFS